MMFVAYCAKQTSMIPFSDEDTREKTYPSP